MSKTVAQIYATNPVTTILNTDLIYLVNSPYTPGTDAAILGSSLKGLFANSGVNTNITSMTGLNDYIQAPTGIKDNTGNIIVEFSAPNAPSNFISIFPGTTGLPTGFEVAASSVDANVSMFFKTLGTSSFQFINAATNITNPVVFFPNGSAGHKSIFTWGTLSADRTYTFPNASGTIALTSSIPSFPLSLANGGTNAALTASNGGIVWSNASQLQILSGTATSNLPLLSGSTATPSWGSFALSLGGALTTAGALTTSGAFGATFTFTNTTSVTFPLSGTLATTSQLPTPAALTKTDDTNVTLTLGGTPATALLQATSLTLGWTGQLSLTRGGTNASLTASNGGIFYSTGTAGAILSGTSTAGLALLSGSSTTPSWSNSPPITKINTVVITNTGSNTYTPTASMVFAMVEIVGGGGGSGGSTGTAGQSAAPGGGGGGGYCRKLYTAALLGASATVFIGSGGAAGSSGNNPGGDGTASTFTPAGAGVVLTANLGGGSVGQNSTATVNNTTGGTSGSGAGGDLNITGADGQSGIVVNGAANVCVVGMGGNSYLGTPGFNSSLTGAPATRNYGCGAPGVINITGANKVGQAGSNGICIITEYIST